MEIRMHAAVRRLLRPLLGAAAAGLDALRRPKPVSAYAAAALYLFLMFLLEENTGSRLVGWIGSLGVIPLYWTWTAFVWRAQERRASSPKL